MTDQEPSPDVEPIAPWDRQPEETTKAFAAFALYRDRDPQDRSTAKVGRALGKSKTLMDRWSSQHHWVARVRAWDTEQDRLTQRRRTREIQEVRQHQVTLGRALQGVVAKRMSGQDGLPPWVVPDDQVARVAKVGIELELAGHGEPAIKIAATVDTTIQGSIETTGVSFMDRIFDDPEAKAKMLELLATVAGE